MTAPDETPGAFGIEAGLRKLREYLEHLLTQQHQELLVAIRHNERHLHKMANGFDNLKQLITDQGGAIAQEAAQVNAKLDEQLALIQQLQDTINSGGTVPQEVVDALLKNTQDIQGIVPDNVPSPTPQPARRKP